MSARARTGVYSMTIAREGTYGFQSQVRARRRAPRWRRWARRSSAYAEVRRSGGGRAHARALSALSRYVEQHRADWGLPGMTVCVVDRDGFAGFITSGYANLEARTPVGPDHLFQVGSISKVFTSLTLWSMAQEGKLSLGAKVADLMPETAIAGGGDITRAASAQSHLRPALRRAAVSGRRIVERLCAGLALVLQQHRLSHRRPDRRAQRRAPAAREHRGARDAPARHEPFRRRNPHARPRALRAGLRDALQRPRAIAARADGALPVGGHRQWRGMRRGDGGRHGAVPALPARARAGPRRAGVLGCDGGARSWPIRRTRPTGPKAPSTATGWRA